MTQKDLPVSGYTILAVYTTTQELKPVAPEKLTEQEQVAVSWDWRWLERRVLEVRLGIRVDDRNRGAHFSSDCVGRFHQVEDTPAVDLEEFVSLQAVAMLLPYLRQYLSLLTLNTLAGSYLLPSLNVTELRKDFNLSGATGKKQDVSKLKDRSKPRRLEAHKKR